MQTRKHGNRRKSHSTKTLYVDHEEMNKMGTMSGLGTGRVCIIGGGWKKCINT